MNYVRAYFSCGIVSYKDEEVFMVAGGRERWYQGQPYQYSGIPARLSIEILRLKNLQGGWELLGRSSMVQL
jgi:hypothetical protein